MVCFGRQASSTAPSKAELISPRWSSANRIHIHRVLIAVRWLYDLSTPIEDQVFAQLPDAAGQSPSAGPRSCGLISAASQDEMLAPLDRHPGHRVESLIGSSRDKPDSATAQAKDRTARPPADCCRRCHDSRYGGQSNPERCHVSSMPATSLPVRTK